ncbi:MAG: hypothetical protein COU35_05245 [Candidatus Magasanikbacteria bacterium CG10_big_fil_rev_8_21_14_0_10_47_10]|uniref:NADAR domain-containing protein n=1 Tax=Candidatus Magasanikbacteria bacterium CG10_big_fil_rev_8_21_14_0_10_47_10 TaxID=1974652 RepID=A0A2H0TP22_9BACT|nr:MAG: hypothetical protein COU35_05245 [Candidatus Magasanikbacteria bacterium CG10_big_fil_rev_8_21_14_0_10_47_10]
MKKIGFYEGSFYMLSNFSAHEVLYKGVLYKTSEHAYQVAKFEDQTLKAKIADAASAYLAREYGQSPEGRGKNIDKVATMKEIMRAKLEQHADVKRSLIETGDSIIEKNHPLDSFWGTGSDGMGENVMGKIWMELRNEISK